MDSTSRYSRNDVAAESERRGGFLAARVDRRTLFTGALMAAAAPTLARASSSFGPRSTAPANSWLNYEAQLRARLADAGGGQFQTNFAKDLLAEANGFRRTQRLAAYTWDEGLAACARAHAADMARRGYFGHETPEGFKPIDRASLLMRDLCGPVTENLAWRDDPARGSTPRQFEELWENSHGHRDNLLQPTCTHAGYGVVKVGSQYYAAGMYADAAIRLPRPLPLKLSAGSELAPALDGASPHIQRLALTRPGQDPTRLAPPLSKMTALEPGIWQLRPMQAMTGNLYDVLNGPMVFVG